MNVPLPKKLYHATYAPLVGKIKREGLGGKSSRKKWEDSKKGVTYWATDPEIAYSYAESSEMVPDDWLDEIVVFECDIRNFDPDKLFVDENVLLDDDCDPNEITFEYHGIMDFNRLKTVEDF